MVRSSAEKEVEKDKKERAVLIPFPDGVFEMPIVLMIYGDAQMFFSLLMLLM